MFFVRIFFDITVVPTIVAIVAILVGHVVGRVILGSIATVVVVIV